VWGERRYDKSRHDAIDKNSAIIGEMKERESRRTYWTRYSRENYKGIGLRENGEADVGTGTDKNRIGVADHKYF
jgi:hypothetical protein